MPRLTGLVGHVLASAVPARTQELVALGLAVRAPLSLSTRVGVVGMSGGVGCSVVAGLVASTFAARRPGHVLAVNASAGGRSLLWHAGYATPEVPTPHDLSARSRAASAQEAIADLPRTAGGVYCLDLASDGGPVDERRWWDGVGPAGRFFDVVVTDFGARTANRCGAVAAASSVVCVVTDAERSSWQHGVDLAASFLAVGVPAVLVANAVHAPAAPWCRAAVRLSPVPAVLVPHDPAHGAAAPAAGWTLGPGTARAALRVCAGVVGTQARATGSAPDAERAGEAS